MMEFSIYQFLAAVLAITLGAVMQAATGLGAGLIVVPLLALISLELVPGPVIFASLILSFLMAWGGREPINLSNIDKILLGLLAGMVAGAYGIAQLPLESLGLVFGLLIVLAVLASFAGLKVGLTPANLLTAGALSGFMGTTAAIGAPVLALLYQHEDGKTLRATLGLLYFVSSIAMLALLHIAGHFSLRELALGAYLIPGFLIGYFLAGKLARTLDQGYSRIAVLLISSVSAIVLIVKSVI